MRRQARVVDADASGKTLVELDAITQCLRCSRGEGCGAAMIGPQQSGLQLWVADSGQASVETGQQVLLEIDEQGSGWLWSVFAAYGLPLLGLLLSTALSTVLVSTLMGKASAAAELVVVVSALVGLCGGIFAWRLLAPSVLARAERSLCLQSARIVVMYPALERET